MLWLMNNLDRYGWKFIFWLFIPLYVEQDTNLKNGGYDIISFRQLGGSYFHGTYLECNRFINHRC
jgi:hypothetical protein